MLYLIKSWLFGSHAAPHASTRSRAGTSSVFACVVACAALGLLGGCATHTGSSGEVEDSGADAEAADAADTHDATAPDADRIDAGEPDAEVSDANAASDATNMDASPEADAPDAQPEAGDDASSSDGGPDATPGDAAPDGTTPDAMPDAGICPHCLDGRCLPNGTCVECSDSLPCQEPGLKCELSSHTCVECRPSADDCAAGAYCNSNFVCVRGCKDDASCASGQCDQNHECTSCLADLECGAGHVCGTLSCGAACGGSNDPSCATGSECCDGRCVDTTRDIAHCGACQQACTATQFCGTAGCTEVALEELCNNAKGTLVLSGQSGDAAESALLLTALESGCTPAPSMSTINQAESALINPETGRPVAGGNRVLVTLGSGYGNKLVSYLESERIAPVYMAALSGDPAAFEFRRSSNNEVLLHRTAPDETATHAHFLLQIVRDPTSGSLVVSAYGYWAEGTVAARWYLTNKVLPALSSYTQTWYLYEWESTNADVGPDVGDTFTLIDSGT